ncbi:MAG: MiaB/RimO family radical SAM methylthiotransferase [Deltaproteobacteria bacterium]|nr:MiaB/RimO family radical SAM methylthiotransferase [Deltaproteobacteria bacterium]
MNFKNTFKFRITTLGCKVNQYETDAIAQQLKASDCVPASSEDKADLCIINTCTVTQKASMQSRQAVRQAIRSNPKARIVVTGCYAQTEPDEILKIDGVHTVIGHGDKHKIPEIVRSSPMENNRRPTLLRRNISSECDFKQVPVTVFGERTRPFLKIQDGCNTFCTYCIVPYARGRSRSMAPEKVLEHISHLKHAGYHEVVLTGVHLGAYGLDLSPKYHVFCNHFHIPLQSGDDFVLKKMHRPYTRSFLRDLIVKTNSLIPDAAIGVDALIGFPGETEKAFENTYSLIKELPVTYLHVFPFSVRKGTPAGKYPQQVDSRTIKARCEKMRTLGNQKKEAFYKKFIGKKVKILIESKRDESTGLLKGITSNYIPVRVNGGDNWVNTIVPVRIDRVDKNQTVFGTLSSDVA